jgi:hypothetical protein
MIARNLTLFCGLAREHRPRIFAVRNGAKTACLGVVVAAVVGVANPVLAHHSFAMFDTVNRITLAGTVTAFEWTNPHAFIELDVANEKGAGTHWSVEMGSPSILLRAGWKYSDIKYGDKVTLLINPLKNGQPGGMLAQATLPDGRVLGNGGPPPAGGRRIGEK